MRGIVVLTTAPDLRTARVLARRLVSERSAACVTIKENFVSIYRWKGKIARSREALILIKSEKRRFARIQRTIRAVHPYEVPEIISLPILQGSREYLSWLRVSLK